METVDVSVAKLSNAIRECNTDLAVVYDNGIQRSLMTYGQLYVYSRQVANLLRLHIGENEVTGICVERNINTAALLIGILEAKCSFFPIDLLTINSAQLPVDTLGVRAFFVTASFVENVLSLFGRENCSVTPCVIGDISLIVRRRSQPRLWPFLAYVITTSGTTGQPKIVRVPHSCIVPNIVDFRSKFKVVQSDVVLQMTPLTFDPSVIELFLPLASGACMLVVPDELKMNPSLLTDVIVRNQATIVQMTPALLHTLGCPLVSRTLLGSQSVVRVLALGGEAFPSGKQIRAYRHCDNATELYNLYGITEVSCWASIRRVDIWSDCTSLGCPLSHTYFDIRNENNESDSEGFLYIGSNVRMCHIDAEEDQSLGERSEQQTAATMVMRATGDWVRRDDSGEVWFVERRDKQVKRWGRKMCLRSIEQAWERLDNIVAAVALLDADTQLLYVCCLSTLSCTLDRSQCDKQTQLVREVNDHIRQSGLPAHYLPNKVLIVDNIPMTRHGKTDRVRLLNMVKEQLMSSATNSLSSDDVEAIVRDQWLACVGCAPVDEATLAECGGTSLQALSLAHSLHCLLHLPLAAMLDTLVSRCFSEVVSYLCTGVMAAQRGDDGQLETVTAGYVGITELASEDNNSGTASVLPSLHVQSSNVSFISNGLSQIAADELAAVERTNTRLDFTNQEDVRVSRLNERFHSSQHVDLRTQTDSSNLNETISIDNPFNAESVMHSNLYFLPQDICHAVSRTNSVSCCARSGVTEIKRSRKEVTSCPYCAPVDCGTSEVTLDFIAVTHMWSHNLGKCIDASPLVIISRDRRMVVVGSHSHQVCAVDSVSGDAIWTRILPDRVESSACLSYDGRLVFVGCYDGCLYGLHTNTGQVIMCIATDGPVKSSPCIDSHTRLVFFGSHDQAVRAVDCEDDKARVVWVQRLAAGSLFASPTVSSSPHHVYCATLGGLVVALVPSTGNMVWSHDLGQPIFSSPAVSSEAVVVACVDKRVYGFSHAGSKFFTTSVEGAVFSSVTYWPESALNQNAANSKAANHSPSYFYGCHDNKVYALTINGDVVWTYSANSAVYSSPFVFQAIISPRHLGVTVVCACSTAGTLYLLDVNTGRCLATHNLPGQVFSSPVVVDNALFIGCRDNNLYCLQLDCEIK